MIERLGKGRDLKLRDYSSWKASYRIKHLKQKGFQAEYADGEWSVIICPNYKEADEIVSAWVGAETMQEVTEDSWEYIDDNRE